VSKKRIDIVFGTRPEAIKLVPIIQRLREDKNLLTRVVVTAQHRELLDQILEPFAIQPDIDLNLMQPNQGLNQLASRAIKALGEGFEKDRPDLVLVQGDTTTAFCAALAAFHLDIPTGHVEAGLRSGNRRQPFPEEANRRMVSAFAELHFSPTATSTAALRREGIPEAQIFETGNSAIDALSMVLSSKDLNQRTGSGVLVTLHRRETWKGDSGGSFEGILQTLVTFAKTHPDVPFLYPVHPNPNVRKPVAQICEGIPNFELVDPLDYIPFLKAMAGSRAIVSDSGGVQEEAPSMGVPVLVVRDVTERPEGLFPGGNRLVGTEAQDLNQALEDIFANPPREIQSFPLPNPFGDGRASQRIHGAIRHFFFGGKRPEPFLPAQTFE
jgi:UDP-N-acetylglucosamine 2-epimerase (non-hydrolysing)